MSMVGTGQTSPRDTSLLAIAVIGLATFPVAGSAAALMLQAPRRNAQIAALVFWGVVFLYGVGALGVQRLVHSGAMRRMWYGAVLSTALVGTAATVALHSNQRPAPYAWFAAIATILWLTLFLHNVFDRSSFPPAAQPTTVVWFPNLFLIVLIWMAAAAYSMGPEPRDIYMVFRGSTTQAGTTAAILGAVALATLEGWRRPVGLILALYLSFVATSRAGLILLIGMSGLVLVARGTLGNPRRLHIDGRGLALLVVCAAVVVLPARLSAYYPYASSRPEPVGPRVMHHCYRKGNVVTEGCTRRGQAGARVMYLDVPLTDWQAMMQRYSRFTRLFRGGSTLQQLPADELWQLEAEGRAESRWVLLAQSAATVTTRPLGHWPRPFNETTQIYCGTPLFCRYPHNLILEIGYHFGWIPLGIASVGLFASAVRAFRCIRHSSVAVRVAAIAFLGQLGFSQISGDLTDHLIALGLGLCLIGVEAMLR